MVNTCEYCSETTGQLADTVSKQLDAEQAALVNLEGPQEDFQGAVMAGMRVLVAALESRVAGSLQARPNLNPSSSPNNPKTNPRWARWRR